MSNDSQKPADQPASPHTEAHSKPAPDAAAAAPLDIVEVEPGAYSVLKDGKSFSVVFDGDHVLIDGQRVPVPKDPRDWTGASGDVAAGGPQKILAPMPGRLVSILVKVGDEVEAGAGIVVVEAMKMQNEMKAKQAGKVAAIHAKEGATVAAGEVLVTID